MKFRSLVLLSALAALSVPAVEVTGSNTFGWLKVANLVKTDNLTAGDKLYVYVGGTWYLYVLTDGAWSPATTVATATGPVAAAGAADQTLARGAALFLQRADATKPFYLYGQYDAAAVQTAITADTVDAPIHTLVANPLPTGYDLNGSRKVVGAAGDAIVVPMGSVNRTYTYENDAWGWQKTTTSTVTLKGKERTVASSTRETSEGCTIPAGQGFWYVSKGGAPTFNW